MIKNKLLQAIFIMFCIVFNDAAMAYNPSGISKNNIQPKINIGVFCGADDNISTRFKEIAFSLGAFIAEKNYGLVTGGSKTGLMKEVVDGYVKQAASEHLYGIMPEVLKNYDVQHNKIPKDNLTWVKTLHERLLEFQDKIEIAVILPGGFGTLHELMDFLVHEQFGLIKKRLILFNIDHFWDPLLAQFKVMVETSALKQKHLDQLEVVSTVEELAKLLETEKVNESKQEGLKDRYWEKPN